MSTVDEQREIQQKLRELNAASGAFDMVDSTLRDITHHETEDALRIAQSERASVIEQYVAAKEWLYTHTDGIIYDSTANSFALKHSSNTSQPLKGGRADLSSTHFQSM